MFDKFYLAPRLADSGQPPAQAPAERAAEKSATTAAERLSIAVLPFDNRSNLEEDQFFTDGIHDDLLTTIARIGSMKVISRTSVMEYRGTTKKIPEIARELGVANILEGGIQRAGGQVRINVQLIDAESDRHLWAQSFDRELTVENLFAIQSEISQKIAAELEATLSPAQTQRINRIPTHDLAAYDAYLRGKQLMAARVASKLEQAMREFRKAVQLDPDFALAWVGLADSYYLLPFYGNFDRAEMLPMQDQAVGRALEIDPDLGEAYVSMAMIHAQRGELGKFESAALKAIELSPNYASAYHFYGAHLLRLFGVTRIQEAIDLLRKAAELDPRSAIIGHSLAEAYDDQGLYSLAEQQYEHVIEISPAFAQGHVGLALLYGSRLGRYDLAFQRLHRALAIDPRSRRTLVSLLSFSTEVGDIEAAERYRRQLAGIYKGDWSLAYADIVISLARGDAAGTEEAAGRLVSTPSINPDYSNFLWDAAVSYLTVGDPASARHAYLHHEPDWLNPEAWERFLNITPTGGCIVAQTLADTGNTELGAALLDQTLEFFTRLPTLIEHADTYELQFCYLMAGDSERALDQIETQLAHNHLGGWKRWDQLPMYDRIRAEPRY